MKLTKGFVPYYLTPEEFVTKQTLSYVLFGHDDHIPNKVKADIKNEIGFVKKMKDVYKKKKIKAQAIDIENLEKAIYELRTSGKRNGEIAKLLGISHSKASVFYSNYLKKHNPALSYDEYKIQVKDNKIL